MSRRSRRSQAVTRVGGIPLILLQILVGALLAIVLGVWLGKFYISRVLKDSSQPEITGPEEEHQEGEKDGQLTLPPAGNETPTSPEKVDDDIITAVDSDTQDRLTARISAVQFYRVQAGAFSQEGNAQGLLKELGELGFTGLISASGGMYRVSVGLFTSKSGAEDFVNKLGVLQGVLAEEPLILAETLPETVLTYPIAEKECSELIIQTLGKTSDLIAAMESLWLMYISAGRAGDQINAELERINREVSLLAAAYKEVSPLTAPKVWDEVCLLPGDLEATLTELRKEMAAGRKWMPFPRALARLVYLWPSLL